MQKPLLSDRNDHHNHVDTSLYGDCSAIKVATNVQFFCSDRSDHMETSLYLFSILQIWAGTTEPTDNCTTRLPWNQGTTITAMYNNLNETEPDSLRMKVTFRDNAVKHFF